MHPACSSSQVSLSWLPWSLRQEANRESAARSRDKRLKLIADLEVEVEQLKKQHNEFKVPKHYTLESKRSRSKHSITSRTFSRRCSPPYATFPPFPRTRLAHADPMQASCTDSMPAQAKQFSHLQ